MIKMVILKMIFCYILFGLVFIGIFVFSEMCEVRIVGGSYVFGC